MTKHRYKTKLSSHSKLYEHMLKLGLCEFYIEMIENYPCKDIYELRAREGHFIREIGTLNQHVPGRSRRTWYEDNRESLKLKQKVYNEEHKEQISARKSHGEKPTLRRSNRKIDKDTLNDKTKLNKQTKQSRLNNPEKYQEQMRTWRENNRERKLEMDRLYRERKNRETNPHME